MQQPRAITGGSERGAVVLCGKDEGMSGLRASLYQYEPVQPV